MPLEPLKTAPESRTGDAGTLRAAAEVLSGKSTKGFMRRLWPFLFLGAALGFQLLFHLPLLRGGTVTALVTFVILALDRYGFRPVGTMAGQVIMQGFLHRKIPVWIRRAVTMLPSLVVILLGLDLTRTLVMSQIILSFGIPFALVPLVLFTQRTDVMGDLLNHRLTTMLAGLAHRRPQPLLTLPALLWRMMPC